jgi:IMP dehydrogenase
MHERMNLTLSYDDVLLQPQYSDIRSRSEIDISTDLGRGITLELPVIASPMDTIAENTMASAMAEYGGLAVLHRYNTIEKQAELGNKFFRASHSGIHNRIGAAIGVGEDFMNRAKTLVEEGIRLLCIDVAHGHHQMTKEALQALRDEFSDTVHIMAGNVATLEGVNDLADWGADSVRCNIGGGSICSTRVQTGHGLPGLQTIFECAKTDRDVKIIADGGIKNSGDMVKALAAGADAVMIGSMLSGTDETPGTIYRDSDGLQWKSYRGMASKEAQMEWRGKYSSFEGVAARVPYRGPVGAVLADIERGIRSGLSYSGARDIAELQVKAKFVRQTTSGLSESRTHILTRSW